MKDYIIRRLSFDKIKGVAQIVAKVLEDDFPEYEPRVSLIYRKHIFNTKYFFKLHRKKSNIIFGAFAKNELVGIIVVIGDFGGVAFIDWLAVKKQYRYLGIAKALLKATENWLLEHYYHNMYLYTESKKNIEYYKRRGFEYVGVRKNSWFGADEHLLQKNFRGKPFEEMFEKYVRKEEF